MEDKDWVFNEVQSENFGDKRLKKRFEQILTNFTFSPEKSVSGSNKGWSETIAAYRFIGHHKVTPQKILGPHIESTLSRIKSEKVVLIPQDTTEFDFTGRKSMNGVDYLAHENSQTLTFKIVFFQTD